MRCTRDWDQISAVWENFTLIEPVKFKTVELKRQAELYLGIKSHHNLSKHEFKLLLSKAHKIKNHTKKEERARIQQLEKQILNIFNH